MFKFEKKIIDYISKNYIMIGFIFTTFVALAIRFFELPYKSRDYEIFLSGWFDFFESNGGIKALKNFVGDYNAPYNTLLALLTYIPVKSLYLIKSLSILFDFVLAGACSYLLYYIKNKKEFALVAYAAVLFLPTVIFNSALWGQCDSIYTSFVIIALILLLKEKYKSSFVFLGLAFAFKLQFIFILPIFIVLYFSKKKFSIFNFLIIPLVNVILCLPAIIAGNSLKNVLTIYFTQASEYNDSLVLNFLNIYNLIPGSPDIFYKVGELVSIFVCAAMLAYVIYKNVKWNNEKILNLALWFVVIVTFLLPGMHDRYLFVGDVLAVIVYLAYKKNLFVMISVNLASLLVYSNYLFDFSLAEIDYVFFTIIYMIIIIYYTKYVLELLSLRLKNDD